MLQQQCVTRDDICESILMNHDHPLDFLGAKAIRHSWGLLEGRRVLPEARPENP
jgi:hypothetical protein